MRRHKFTPAERFFVSKRAHFLCEYCATPQDYSPDTFNIEHVISLFKSGTDDLKNMAFACGGCNGGKRNLIAWINPESGISTPLFHPRQDIWREHFSWSEDFTLLIGLTPKGRATIDLLKMNRPRLINLRKALIAYGVHPAKY